MDGTFCQVPAIGPWERARRKLKQMNQIRGWSWAAFFAGPFWYISKGMPVKGLWLLFLCIITLFCALPFVCFYCAARGKRDWYNKALRERSYVDIKQL